MIVYLASPKSQQQAEHVEGMPVLLSYTMAAKEKWLLKGYQQSFGRILIDSGAFSELNSGVKVDIDAYAEWGRQWLMTADAVAGLDDISGDWKKSLANYARFPESFPTIHDTDPDGLLDDLIAIAKEGRKWLGIGLKPPREGKEVWVRSVLDRVPDGIHVHGWALRQYTHLRRLDSVDSTNWWRDAMAVRTQALCRHLTYGECLEIVVKRYKRWTRDVITEKAGDGQKEK